MSVVEIEDSCRRRVPDPGCVVSPVAECRVSYSEPSSTTTSDVQLTSCSHGRHDTLKPPLYPLTPPQTAHDHLPVSHCVDVDQTSACPLSNSRRPANSSVDIRAARTKPTLTAGNVNRRGTSAYCARRKSLSLPTS